MESKRIVRSVGELPQWYDLCKYKGTSSLDTASWYELILQRWHHFFFIDLNAVEYCKGRSTDGKNHNYDALLQIREDPLFLLAENAQIGRIGGPLLSALKNDVDTFSKSSYAIRPLTYRRLYENENRLCRSTIERVRKWSDKFFDGLLDTRITTEYKKEYKWALTFIDDPIIDVIEKQNKGQQSFIFDLWNDRDFIEVDLSVPDKTLIQQFKAYLCEIREKYPHIKESSKFKYPEYQKWIDYSVLPYIDLTIWAMENEVSIPYRVMADAIFPDGEKGEEMVRKTTKKIVDMLLDVEYINFFATILAQEIMEKKSQKNFRKK